MNLDKMKRVLERAAGRIRAESFSAERKRAAKQILDEFVKLNEHAGWSVYINDDNPDVLALGLTIAQRDAAYLIWTRNGGWEVSVGREDKMKAIPSLFNPVTMEFEHAKPDPDDSTFPEMLFAELVKSFESRFKK